MCIFEQPEHLPLRGTQRGVPYLGMYGWRKGFIDLWVSLRKMTCHPRDGPFLSQWALLRERNPERGNCPCHHCSWRPWGLALPSVPRKRKLGLRLKDELPPGAGWAGLGWDHILLAPPAPGRAFPLEEAGPISLSLGGVSQNQVFKGKSLF